MGVTQVLLTTLHRTQQALTVRPRRRANRVAPALSNEWDRQLGSGQAWMPLSYGEYYPRSALVYAAIKMRQDALARVPVRVYRRLAAGAPREGDRRRAVEAVEPAHPAQRLLDSPNPFWTRGDLWRATETSLGLWGSAFWGLERDETGQVTEIWPLRSDRMRVIPDPARYIKGFVYVGQGRQIVSYLAEDVVWIRYFNPLDEYAGLSPIAPLRLSADMGLDALRANRSNLTNDSTPGLFVETEDTPTDDEVREFYERWESRFQGVNRGRRPALLSGGMTAKNLGFSPKEMLGDIERVSFANFATARRVFWEDTLAPQMAFYAEALQQMLLPNFGDPSLFVEFDTSEVEALQENESDKATRRKTYVSGGIMTVNEVRQEMNLRPVPWGDGPSESGGSSGA